MFMSLLGGCATTSYVMVDGVQVPKATLDIPEEIQGAIFGGIVEGTIEGVGSKIRGESNEMMQRRIARGAIRGVIKGYAWGMHVRIQREAYMRDMEVLNDRINLAQARLDAVSRYNDTLQNDISSFQSVRNDLGGKPEATRVYREHIQISLTSARKTDSKLAEEIKEVEEVKNAVNNPKEGEIDAKEKNAELDQKIEALKAQKSRLAKSISELETLNQTAPSAG